ncbi:PAS domain S-box protein [Flavobacteriaceae bacterium S356]|uniref:histidine kinase n=1 Tax=Asprobacillus argus TaxID=3076534 RepID=A0ABU3LBS1_9FLAO|nr:PAS domain S-box protein [Flavobacteriaceae bacterium S356]
MQNPKLNILEKALAREKKARKEAEKILEEKSLELYEKREELVSINENLAKVIDQKTIEFKGIFDNIIDSYILMDLHGNVLKMNKPAVKFFGFDIKKERFNVTDIIYEEDYEYAYESFYRLISQGHFSDYQARIYTKSREIKWVQINSSIVTDTEGIPTFAHGIVRDITEAKEQQVAFEEQKQQLDAIVDYSSLGIALSAEDGSFLKTNNAFQKLLGYNQDEFFELKIADISLREDEKVTKENLTKLSKGEIEHFTINKRYRAKSGKVIWAKTSVAAVRNADRSIRFRVALIEDITEELKKGALLEALNNLMSSILGKTNIYEIAWEITQKTIGLLGFEDCVIYLLDKEKRELAQIAAYGDKVSSEKEVLNSMKIPLGGGIVGTVAKTGNPEIIPDTSKDKRYIIDDKMRYSEISVPIIADGEIIGVIDSEHTSKNFFTKDHLETLKTIAGLAATQLKNALSLRLREEAEKQKEILLKDLTKSNQELNDFAHVVSHDLKSPLRSMNALVSWLQEDCSDSSNEDIDTNFNLLLKKIDRMDLLINGILSYASVDKVEKKDKPIDLEVLVRDLLDTIHVPDHIQIEFKAKLPVVKADSFKMIQLFQNLLSNAIKYSDKERGEISIDCISKKHEWEFQIKDNGMGISEKYYEKIFKVFQVLEESEESSGVGLSIVKKIIAFYNGKIWLESKLKQGTTFFFTLPK